MAGINNSTKIKIIYVVHTGGNWKGDSILQDKT